MGNVPGGGEEEHLVERGIIKETRTAARLWVYREGATDGRIVHIVPIPISPEQPPVPFVWLDISLPDPENINDMTMQLMHSDVSASYVRFHVSIIRRGEQIRVINYVNRTHLGGLFPQGNVGLKLVGRNREITEPMLYNLRRTMREEMLFGRIIGWIALDVDTDHHDLVTVSRNDVNQIGMEEDAPPMYRMVITVQQQRVRFNSLFSTMVMRTLYDAKTGETVISRPELPTVREDHFPTEEDVDMPPPAEEEEEADAATPQGRKRLKKGPFTPAGKPPE